MKPVFWRRVGALLAVQALGVALYAGSLRFGPVWDDHAFVEANVFLRSPANLLSALDPRHLTHVLPVPGCARPVWLASVLAETAALGDGFFFHKLGSALWHAWAAGALMVLCSALGEGAPAALAAGLVFLFHPVHAEVVEVVTFRSDLLALFFMALSLSLYASGREREGRSRLVRHALALASFAAALLSKEMAVVEPALALAIDAFFPSGRWRGPRRWATLGAMGLLLVAYMGFRAPRSGYVLDSGADGVTRLLQRRPELFMPFSGEALPGDPPAALGLHRRLPGTPPWLAGYYEDAGTRARTSVQLLAEDARLLLWPRRLQGIYDPRPAAGWLDARVAGGAAFLLLALGGAWRWRRRLPLAAFGLVWLVAALLPVSGLFALRNLEAERYLLVPSAGLALTAGALFSEAWRRRQRRPAAAAVLAAALALGAARVLAREPAFRDDAAFHGATVASDPGSPRAHAALARALVFASALPGAEAEYRRALSLWPGFERARDELASVEALQARVAARPVSRR